MARRGAPIILMHTRGRSRDMYEQASYHDVVDEVLDELRESLAFAVGAGVPREADAGRPGHRLRQGRDPQLRGARRGWRSSPIWAGRSWSARRASRSSTRPIKPASLDRRRRVADGGVVTAAALAGVHIVRVHAVREMAQVVRVADEIRKYHRDR